MHVRACECFISVRSFVSLSVCLSAGLSICLSGCRSVCLTMRVCIPSMISSIPIPALCSVVSKMIWTSSRDEDDRISSQTVWTRSSNVSDPLSSTITPTHQESTTRSIYTWTVNTHTLCEFYYSHVVPCMAKSIIIDIWRQNLERKPRIQLR